MESSAPQCPRCSSLYSYQDSTVWICPECFHEWSIETLLPEEPNEAEVSFAGVCDANGVQLRDGDAVIVMKDLKIKGASGSVKSGTKVRSIRIITPVDDHDISCKIDGVGSVYLKSKFCRKV